MGTRKIRCGTGLASSLRAVSAPAPAGGGFTENRRIAMTESQFYKLFTNGQVPFGSIPKSGFWNEYRNANRSERPPNAKQSADGKWYWVEIGPPEIDSKIELTEKLR
jgi:hypothetical protein